jgi:hypothetical protein
VNFLAHDARFAVAPIAAGDRLIVILHK